MPQRLPVGMATAGDRLSGAPAVSGAEALRALNLRLDSHLLQLLVEMEELEGKRVALNARVEEGWFSLSKARYAMGARAVGALQYSSSMAPLFRVSTREPEPGRPDFRLISPRLESPKVMRPKEAQSGMPAGEPKSGSPVLRRRPQPRGSPLQPAPPAVTPVTPTERDPLTWFGILVPRSLRQAQGSFRAALLLAGEIAGLQSHIEWERAQVQALRQEKQKLLDRLKVA